MNGRITMSGQFPGEASPGNAAGEGMNTDSSGDERILCQHCRRTTSNGIRCLGMCVADNDY